MKQHAIVLTALLFAAPMALAGAPLAVEWNVPAWIDAMEPFEASAKITGDASGSAIVRYAYPDGTTGTVDAKANEDGAFTFKIPGAHAPQIGEVKLTLAFGDIASEPHPIALAYVEELDITGNPPVVLPFELGHQDYLVRYIPCCNIFGGVLLAKRIPLNPMDTTDGLPETRISDFVVLEPDDLTTSTAGTHFQFGFDPAEVDNNLGLYTYDWQIKGWREVRSYEVDYEAGKVDFLCPEGGTFVLGLKQ